VSALANHLWQSLACVALVHALVAVTRRNSALVRLWLWHVAALKFVVPFAVFSGVGAWVGFPVRFAGDPPPASLMAWMGGITPLLTPGSWLTSPVTSSALLLVLLLAAALSARVILGHIHREALAARVEELRLDADPDDREPTIGFFRAALFTACAVVVTGLPFFGGALRASAHAHDVLELNTRSLSQARVTLRPAAPGLGSRYFVEANAHGVLIRNATVRELTALAYGVNRFFVRGKHFKHGDEEDWLIDQRYDARIDATVVEPGNFDTYALRHAITRELATNFGLEIYVNSDCQDPCGKWADRVLTEVAPGTWRLVEKAGEP
jgi:hypothetical protein